MLKKFENIWYYYKYYILGGIVALVAIAFAVGSCVNKGTYDIKMLYMTHGYVDIDGGIDTLMSEYASDVNRDGVSNVQVITINYGTTLQEAQSAGAARAANLTAGENVLFLVDEQNYNELKENGFLMDISDLGQSQYLNGDRFDATASGMLSSVEGFEKSELNYYLCIRTYDESKASIDKNYDKRYEAAYSFIKNVTEKYK